MRMSRSPQNGGFHKCTGGKPVFAVFPTAPAMASSPAARVCPSFAMVCLERSSVTGGFPRDRDRTQAYPLATELAGRRRKSYTASGHGPRGPAGAGAIMAHPHGGGIAPGEKERNLLAI